jgi:hypothetical protein
MLAMDAKYMGFATYGTVPVPVPVSWWERAQWEHNGALAYTCPMPSGINLTRQYLFHMMLIVIWQSAAYSSLRHMAGCVIWQDASYGRMRHRAVCVIGQSASYGSLRHMAVCGV